MSHFIPLTLLTSAFLIFWGCAFLSPVSKWAVKLPRHRLAGIVLGVPCLVWCAWHGCIMLEGGLAKYHLLVWCLVPVISVLAGLYLDYLFARVMGGFFILSANEMIRCAFTYNVPLRPVFSLICLAMGICGLFLLGAPWHLRDALKLAGEKPVLGRCIAAVLAICAVFLCVDVIICM